MDKGMYSPQGDWALPGNNAVAPAYNTKKISAADAPKNWEGLLDPKWKGQFGMTTDMKLWSVLSLAEGGWGVEKTAPHPNAARLFLEWTFTPQGLAIYEEATGYGAAFAGSGTRVSKLLAGVPLIYRTEEVTLKIIETKLEERFAKILGVTPE